MTRTKLRAGATLLAVIGLLALEGGAEAQTVYGTGASTTGSDTTGIGGNASATGMGATALGAGTTASGGAPTPPPRSGA